MIPEEEKKLVIKELFPEWTIENLRGITEISRDNDFPGLCINLIEFQYWNPNEYRVWWPEIFRKIADKKMVKELLEALEIEMEGTNPYSYDGLTPIDAYLWHTLTVETEYLWAATVRILE